MTLWEKIAEELRQTAKHIEKFLELNPVADPETYRKKLRDTAGHLKMVAGTKELGEPSTSKGSTPPSSATKSSARASGKMTNLAEEVNPIADMLIRLELAVATPEGQTLRSNILHELRQLQSRLYDPEVLGSHIMNIDITEDVHIFDLWEKISGHIRDEAKADCWGDAQRIHITDVAEKTLDALAAGRGGVSEQQQTLLMKAISEPDFDKTEKVAINDKAPWLKDPDIVALKERIQVGKRFGGKNILTTIKEAEAFLKTQNVEQVIKRVREDAQVRVDQLHAQDMHDQLSSSGKERLTELSGRVQGIDTVIRELGMAPPDPPKERVFSHDSYNQLRDVVALLVRKLCEMPMPNAHYPVAPQDIQAYAKKAGLI